jgi:hypothetical protein
MQCLTVHAGFNEGLPSELAKQVVQQFCDEHPERHLPAFARSQMGEHELLCGHTDAEMYPSPAALNPMECVAFIGSATSSR